MSENEILSAYLGAILRGDRRSAFQVIDRAYADGRTPGFLYMEVLQPALREIGRLWQENAISVADEHVATAITQAAMGRVFDAALPATSRLNPLLVAACADVERHEIGLRMVCDLLELEGWDTVFLGAAVPVESLVEMVRRRRPEVVALSVSLHSHLPRLETMVRALRGGDDYAPPVVMVGGRPFLDDPTLAERLGADLTATSAQEAVQALARLVKP